MCGRYATTRSAPDLAELFEATDETADGLVPDYNVAPTDPVPIVRRSRRVAGPVLGVARWGLVPSWAKDTRGAARMINARAETVTTTRAYATSFASRRCLVPADGWYEWVRHGPKQRQAYYLTRRDGDVLAFAGLWTAWQDGLVTCAVVTTAAQGELALVHDRMPLVLAPGYWRRWLDADPAGASELLAAAPAAVDGIEVRPVGAAVGDVRNDGPQLLARVPETVPLHGTAHERHDLTLF